jgi:archaellum component FlaF (FlaF/FlaG flagellin family)
MGFGTIIAGVYFVAVLIVSGYVITDTVNRMSHMSYESVLTAGTIQYSKLDSSARITGINYSDDGSRIYVNLLNTGELKIVSGDLPKIDILLTYTYTDIGTNSQITQTHWCYYGSNIPSEDQWSKNSTIQPNPSPAIIDPLDWDPSKTLSITIVLAPSQYITPGSNVYLKVILPGGASTAETFAFDG